MTQQIFEAIRSLQQFQINCFSNISTLTHAQTFVLLTVGEFMQRHGSSPQPSQLSEYLQIAPASVTPILNKLEDAGFIERVYSKQDRRQVFIELTEKGNEEYSSMTKQIHTYYHSAAKEVGVEYITQFIEFSKKIDAFNRKRPRECMTPPCFKNDNA